MFVSGLYCRNHLAKTFCKHFQLSKMDMLIGPDFSLTGPDFPTTHILVVGYSKGN